MNIDRANRTHPLQGNRHHKDEYDQPLLTNRGVGMTLKNSRLKTVRGRSCMIRENPLEMFYNEAPEGALHLMIL